MYADSSPRFKRSAVRYGHQVTVLGVGEQWRGGDMEITTGGGQKVNLLADALSLAKIKDEDVVMFVDSYDVVIAATEEDILDKFAAFQSRLVFSAEDFCWPDRHLKDIYPGVSEKEYRFLNSGGFIGYADTVYKALTYESIKDNDDDQRFYTKLFLNTKQRKSLSIKLDTKTEIFQNLHGALNEVTLVLEKEHSYLFNNKTSNKPLVIHGNGPIKIEFDVLANYLADEWTIDQGCKYCKDDLKDITNIEDSQMPTIFMSLILDEENPFADFFFNNIANLNYPKERIHIFIYFQSESNRLAVESFRKQFSNEYSGFEVQETKMGLSEAEASNHAIREALDKKVDYFLFVDGSAQIENNATLRHLVTANRDVVAPMLARPGKLWTNFWGGVDSYGFYKRSIDYEFIVNNARRGMWVIPHVANIYLIEAKRTLPQLMGAYSKLETDTDIAFASRIREKKIFIYIDNRQYFGHLVVTDGEKVQNKAHPDMYEIFNNKYTWEKKYLNELFAEKLALKLKNEMPCPDVYWLPLMSEKFCDDMIDEVEHFGQWSGGRDNYKDERIVGGYENVPTVDIHMNQIGWEQHWLHVVKEYIAQYSSAIFTGHTMEGKSHMNFVVRYKPGEQDRLRPHHDASTITVNMALNRAGKDFQGGGPRFIRYNCSLPNTRKGWLLMNPGRVTHYHEGLPTTHGTRYIFVSFIDP